MLFEGSGVAIVTPFDKKGEIDLAGLEELIAFQLVNGTKAIIVNGTTGEASTLTYDEKIQIIQKTVAVVDGRVPVIAGTGSNNTYETASFSADVTKLGVDGLLVVTPYYNKASRRGLYEHFKTVAESTTLPILLYTVPSRTGMTIPVETVAELAAIENIVGLKDASGDLGYTARVRNATPRDFAIYSGNDDLIVPVMSVGGSGVISVLANVAPKETQAMVQAYLDGDATEATRLQLAAMPLVDALFAETSPIPVKAALTMMNLPSGGLRLPLFEAEDATEKGLKEAMEGWLLG